MEKEIQITTKLLKCRDTAKRFFKEEYEEKIEPYSSIIQSVMKANDVNPIPALLIISETKTYQENAMGQMLFLAATTELINDF